MAQISASVPKLLAGPDIPTEDLITSTAFWNEYAPCNLKDKIYIRLPAGWCCGPEY